MPDISLLESIHFLAYLDAFLLSSAIVTVAYNVAVRYKKSLRDYNRIVSISIFVLAFLTSSTYLFHMNHNTKKWKYEVYASWIQELPIHEAPLIDTTSGKGIKLIDGTFYLVAPEKFDSGVYLGDKDKVEYKLIPALERKFGLYYPLAIDKDKHVEILKIYLKPQE